MQSEKNKTCTIIYELYDRNQVVKLLIAIYICWKHPPKNKVFGFWLLLIGDELLFRWSKNKTRTCKS